MKKTSYILIGAVALVLVASFCLPAVVLERMGVRVEVIKATGDTMELKTGMFMTLRVSNTAWLGAGERGDEMLSVVVSEKEALKEPVIVADKCWEGNFSLVREAGELAVLIDADKIYGADESEREGRSRVSVMVDGDAAKVLELRVPQGMLDSVRTEGVRMTMTDFRQDALKVSGSPVAMERCEIGELSF